MDHPCHRRRALLLCAACAVTGASPSFAQNKPIKLQFQLDWRFEAGTTPYVVALRKGYFAAENLDVVLNVGAGASATVTRLASGNADMGVGDMSSLAEFAGNNQHIPAQAVMSMYESTPAAVFSLSKSNIRKPIDLKGLQLAAPVSDGARKIFPLFAANNGLDFGKDISWLSVEPALRETMLARGQVVATTGYLASGMVSLQRVGVSPADIRVMRFSDYGVDLYGNAILASSAFMKSNPDAVAGFLRAVTRAFKDIVVNRDEAISLLKQQDPLIDARIEMMRLGFVVDQEIGTPAVRKNGIGGIDAIRYQKGINALAVSIGFKTTPQAVNLFNDKFLPSAAQRQVFQS